MQANSKPSDVKSCFVAIIGRPNVGKSTFINTILSSRYCITSPVAQTTRHQTQLIYNDPHYQIIFFDTPGIHKPQDAFGSYLNKASYNAANNADIIMLIVDGSDYIGPNDKQILSHLQKKAKKIILVINKCDLLKQAQVLAVIEQWSQLAQFSDIVPVSSLKDKNVKLCLDLAKKYATHQGRYYDLDQKSNRSDVFHCGEIVLQQVLFNLKQEVPHQINVVIEKMEQTEAGVYLYATIVVSRKSQKLIVIGKKGAMIKKIRLQAQKELKAFLKAKVRLECFVKVQKDWRKKTNYINKFKAF